MLQKGRYRGTLKGKNSKHPIDVDRLLQLMEEQEWSAYRLSLAIGCSGSYVSHLIEEGGNGRGAKESNAKRLCAVLRCDYEYLFHGAKAEEGRKTEQTEEQQPLFNVSPADPNSAPPVDRCERAIWECHAVAGGIYRYMKLICEDGARQIEKLLIEQNRLLNELLVEWKGGNA